MATLALVRSFVFIAIGFLLAHPFVARAVSLGPNADPRDPKDLTALALAYEHGEGVPKDYNRAAELYCRAARMGYAEAQYGLGWMYANGRGVVHDDSVAATLLDLAAKQGHEHARKVLGYVGEPAGQLPRCMVVTAVVRETEELNEGAAPKAVVELVRRLAPEYRVSPQLALAVIQAESNFDPRAKSPKNAQGLMQLIPETSARFNVRNPYDPAQNIRGGLAYLRWLLAYFQGNVALVAAGYNAGERAVEKYRGVPPYQETRSYVRKILQLFKQEEHPYDPSITEPSPQLQKIKPARIH